MINHFRKKFMVASTLALFLVLITIVGSIGSIAYFRSRQEVNNVMSLLIRNNGELSPTMAQRSPQPFLASRMTREGVFQYRYFSSLTEDGEVVKVNDQHIQTVSPVAIEQLTNRVNRRARKSGLIHYRGTAYAYQTKQTKDGLLTVFLDETLLMTESREIINVGIILGLISMVLYTIILALFSNRAIGPIIQAEKRQQEFITNAGHELKTPLTVISANTEMQELTGGETDWTKSNQQQVARLTTLINNLISLARMQEQQEMQLTTVDATTVLQSAADNFKSVMTKDRHDFVTDLQADVKVIANENYLLELVNILLDNANKYCDDGGQVQLRLKLGKYGKTAEMLVGNTFAAGQNVDYEKFFDRFYRGDTAHSNNKKKGFGIGLSMAQQIVKAFDGKLSAKYQKDMLFFSVKLKRA